MFNETINLIFAHLTEQQDVKQFIKLQFPFGVLSSYCVVQEYKMQLQGGYWRAGERLWPLYIYGYNKQSWNQSAAVVSHLHHYCQWCNVAIWSLS